MEETINLTDILLYLWKKKKIIIVVTVIFALVAFLKFDVIDNLKKEVSTDIQNNSKIIEDSEYSKFYCAQITFSVEKTNKSTSDSFIDVYNNINQNDISDMHFATYLEIIRSQESLNNVKNNLNLDIDLSKLYNSICISRMSYSNVMSIIVVNKDENQALQIVDSLYNEFVHNLSSLYPEDRIVILDKAYILTDEAIASIYSTYIKQAVGDEIALANILVKTDITRLLPSQYIKTLFDEYIFVNREISSSQNIKIVEDLINRLMPQNITEENIVGNSSNSLKKIIIAALIGFILSTGGIIIASFLSNTINSEKDIDTKVLEIVENTSKEDIYDILRIKLEKNKTIVVTTLEENEKATSIVENMVEAFKKNDKKVLLLDSKKNVNISENELKNYDYVIVYAKNILEDASSLMAVQQFKNTVLLVTERKTKLDSYKKAKETLRDVDANLLGSVLIR